MLVNVNVKNMALINKVDIYFGNGLNILTGETGAGKSIIIGSILLALGSKLQKDIVRDETKEALVELTFSIDNPVTLSKLESEGVVTDEDGMLIISRKIVNGKSFIKVNGESMTSSNLKKITPFLIDIHGQHDHQSLLKQDKQLEIIDKFSDKKIEKIKENLKTEYSEFNKLNKILEDFEIDEDKKERNLSFLKFEIDEIENAHLTPGEYGDVEEKYKKISSSKDILEKVNEVYNLIAGDNGDSASEKIDTCCRIAQGINDKDCENIINILYDLESQCDELKRAMDDYVESMSFDPEQCEEISNRYDEINTLIKKYGKLNSFEDPYIEINKYLEEKKIELDKLNNAEELRRETLEKIEKSRKNLEKYSEELSKVRKTTAQWLSQEIIKILNGLNFLDVNFKVDFNKKSDFTSNGTDEVNFVISTNPGESLKPLNQVASGGELSRIMLGFKTLLAKKDDIDTLIFDEIDTGISGKTAQMVAERLKEISQVHQVISITHLPQIASKADEHFLIEKGVIDGKTETNILKLDYDQSVEELSRMLSGNEITDTVRENARELKAGK